jgi:DNA-binding transcriptional regulator YdaS (Cro superfamily)
MDLHTYIADTDRRRALAEGVNCNPDYLWQIATRRRNASTTLATAIEAFTRGEVTRASLRPDVWGPLPRSAPKPKRKAA